MFSRFFIERPIFAAVLSIVITLAGFIAVFSLPIAQYPSITPPTIQVACTYPGASAQVVAEAVASPIEQQVNGVENMLYMSSQCTNDGQYNLTVTFKPGVNLNFAQVLVQNRVNLALPNLPDVVKQTGITTRKRSPDILLLVSLVSPDNSRDSLYLSNYGTLQIKDELARVDGVGDVIMFGQQDYSMRVWVDPNRLAIRNLTATDVVQALRQQNLQVATGQIGQEPVEAGQQIQMPISTLGRLTEPEQFEEIVVKKTRDGKIVRVKDVGRAELGARNRDVTARLDGKTTVSTAVFALPDANSLATADRVRARMEELKKNFPPGVGYEIIYDTTPFIRESVNEVFKSLRDSIILVAVVVLIFLQNWRSALIPLLAVPVAIVGTFAVMAAIGFSLNNLTLFGLVLAIGIVVDDAIVVVEAVEHHIARGLSPKAASIKAMEEVSGPVIAVACVLSAVFLPCAFITGITGQFFRQFALTIAVSTIISAFNSLTLSPALAAILLQPKGAKKDWLGRVIDFLFGWLFWLFNFAFRNGTRAYTGSVRLLLRGSLVALLLYGGLLGLTAVGFTGLPKPILDLLPKEFQSQKLGSFDLVTGLPQGYIPNQDKGYLLVAVQLPDATSVERTREVVNRIDAICHDTKGVSNTIAIAGQSFALGAFGSNFGQMFIILDDYEHRRSPDMHSDKIAMQLRMRLAKEVPDAVVVVLGPPAVQGLGMSGGFKIMIEDRGELGLPTLQGQTENLIAQARQNPRFASLLTIFRANSPQLYVDVNRDECAKRGVQVRDVFATLQVYLASFYVNDFNQFGRTWQVVVQAEGEYRNEVEDIKRLKVRNAAGEMVPMGTLANVSEINGPLILTRYNMYPAAAVNGSVAPGVSSGDGILMMEQVARQELPAAMSFEWTEISLIQLQSGSTAWVLFVLAVVLVFLVLAALYESWMLPLAVILVVPMCILGSIVGVAISASDVNIFTQIGFVVLVGLASKNAILIVEFAKLKREQGMSREEATLEACQLRLRPILMTSFAFILGVLPLMLAHGAGAEMRQKLGTAVFSGMLGVTAFGIFLTPVFFFVIDWLGETWFFRSPMVRWIGSLGLDVLTAGPLRRLGRYIRDRRRKSPLPRDSSVREEIRREAINPASPPAPHPRSTGGEGGNGEA